MSDFIFIHDAIRYKNQQVILKGWINQIRSSNKLVFIELRDGTGYIQVVASVDDIGQDLFNQVISSGRESSIVVHGKITEHPQKQGVFELQLEKFEPVQIINNFPIEKKEHGPDFLLQNRHLWLRSKSQWAIQRIRNTIINATYEFFQNEHFIKIDTPIITSTACEGTTTLFELEYFDLGKAYLSQSGQLYLEAALAAHGRIFDFGPVFRAEKSSTKKHLTEFWMMDAEMAFVEHEGNINIQEQLISTIINKVLDVNEYELHILQRDISKLASIKPPFYRITHKEVVKMLRSVGSQINENIDLGAQDEQLLQKFFDKPVFIEKWPADIKAFYMKRYDNDPDYVLAADLMAPEGFGEIIGGSQREENPEILMERMKKENLSVETFQWYLDSRLYGSVPHSGFGFGLERLVTWIAGLTHIRESIPFPRMLQRFKP